MTTTTSMHGAATWSGANGAWAACWSFALLAACAGCATWTTRSLPAEPIQWNPSSGVRPELVLDGAFDDATGELVISLAAVLPAGSPAPRQERCLHPGRGGGAIINGIGGLGTANPGVGRSVSSTDSKAKEGGGWGGKMGPDLEEIEGIAIGAGVVALAVAVGVAAAALAGDSGEEPVCFIDEAAGHARATTSPTTVAVDQFIVRVVRADGTYLIRSAAGPEVRIPLEPAPFACPGACVATVARRARAGWPPENDLRRERITIEAIPQGGLFGADEAPTASGVVDVTLMP